MFTPFFVQPQQFIGFWQRAVSEQLGRLESIAGEVAKLEEQHERRTGEAIDEATKLWKASFRYGRELGAGYRQATLEMIRQSATVAGV